MRREPNQNFLLSCINVDFRATESTDRPFQPPASWPNKRKINKNFRLIFINGDLQAIEIGISKLSMFFVSCFMISASKTMNSAAGRVGMM